MTKPDKHQHKWIKTETVIPLRNYVFENGKIIKDLITGKDTLTQYICKCGLIDTVDLKRKTQ